MNQTVSTVLSALRKAMWKTANDPHDALVSVRMALRLTLISLLARLTSLSNVQKVASFRIRHTSTVGSAETANQLGKTIDNLLGLDLFVFRRSCWKRALVLHRFLALKGIESQINF